MDLREQLPHLGKEQEDGTISVCGIQIQRPDYKAFIDGSQYKSEADCVAVLLGIDDVNTVLKITRKELQMVYYEESLQSVGYDRNRLKSMSSSEKEKMLSDPSLEKIVDMEVSANIKYETIPTREDKREIFDLFHIFKKLNECIKKGREHGDLTRKPGYTYQKERDKDFECLFSEYYFSYKRDLFLKWAENNGYKIPEELESSPPKKGHIELLSLEKKLDDALVKICPELEKFYNALKEEIDLIGFSSTINTIEQSDLHKIALEYLDNTQEEFKILNKNFIDEEMLFQYSQNRYKMFVGNILKKYIQFNLPSAIAHKKIKTTKEALKIKYTKIKNRL